MSQLDQLKKEIKQEASGNPDKFFATEVLREKGFSRSECSSCGTYFWSSDPDRTRCGEPECSGGYTFIGDSPTTEEYSYTEAWEKYRDFMSERGYKPIKRYPVVARWRDDTEFTQASIYCFQPHVVSGEAEPPAPELVIPQPSLRFNDVDNVGITGRHYVLHDHIGQTCFRKAGDYDQDRYFRDMFEFATEELGIPRQELVLHEDAWGGGGNLGACMEFFVGGLELWNQVYMFYEVTADGYESLDLKVLDMGMGHERITWIAHGSETSYECVMPEVLEKMKKRAGIEVEREVWEEFLPHSGRLNVDEVEDIEEEWASIADKMGIETGRLKKAIKPAAALYSVAEHTRALLFALADGKIPSNSGGGHNLRMVYRRAKDFLERYNWELEIGEIAEWHAEELNELFPELEDSVDEVRKILEVEEEKYRGARKRAEEKLDSIHQQPTVERMIELYESHGVSPEMMEERGFTVPEDFYARVAEEDGVETAVEEKFELEGVEATRLLYYEDEKRKQMDAKVVAVKGDWVALDQTVFYPEGGGQDPDKGSLNDEKVVDVQKQSGVVLHKVPDHDFEEGDAVKGRINWERRLQLMQHHSTTHMVNGATREILGEHIWQAGAHKSVEKARLDVTHYENIDRETLDEIEEKVEKIIEKDLDIRKKTMEKVEAESEHGFRIYQGGAPPGNRVRLVEIEDTDIEACGGTHLSSTGEAGEFVLTGSKRVQDGVIRLEYRAGEAAEQYLSRVENRVLEAGKILGLEPESGEKPREDIIGGSYRQAEQELCRIFSVEPDHLESTIERFREENQEMVKNARELSDYMDQEVELEKPGTGTLVQRARSLYEAWKHNDKQLESLESRLEGVIRDRMENRVVNEEIPTDNVGLLIQVARKLAKEHEASVTLVCRKGAVSASYHEDYDADTNLENYAGDVEGDQNFAKTFDL